MTVAIITGAAGLIGAETARFFSAKGFDVVGIDNDMRSYFFGEEASTAWARKDLETSLKNYTHVADDIRDEGAMKALFQKYGSSIGAIVHTAAQPSHDWAAREPFTDFTVNANGTLNLLEQARQYASEATFIFTSTNKVYGDRPNTLPLVETDTRWTLSPDHEYAEHGIDENMSIDASTHSIFGASKAAADIMVQEYGRYFGMKTGCFRGGCLTGPGHSGAELHGFLAYLVKCVITGRPYTVFGYKGKQVRDNIHSSDLVNAFWAFHENPRVGEVYNLGGGVDSNCSMLEAIQISEKVAGKKLEHTYSETNRTGDHIWWVSDLRKFKSHFPDWKLQYGVQEIIQQIHDALMVREQS